MTWIQSAPGIPGMRWVIDVGDSDVCTQIPWWCLELGSRVNQHCLALQDEARRELLAMSDAQLEDVARVCNRYPDIQLTYELAGGNSAASGDAVSLQVDLQREQAGEIRPVDAPRYATRASLSICIDRVHLPEPSVKGVAERSDQLVLVPASIYIYKRLQTPADGGKRPGR